MELLLYICVLLTSILGFLEYRIRDIYSNLPYNFRYPIIGNLFDIPYSKGQNLLKYGENLLHDKGITTIWLSWIPIVMVSKPTFIKQIIQHNQKAKTYVLLYPWIGKGLLTINEEDGWKKRRHLLTPLFHFNTLSSYTPIFVEHALKLKNELDRSEEQKSELQ